MMAGMAGGVGLGMPKVTLLSLSLSIVGDNAGPHWLWGQHGFGQLWANHSGEVARNVARGVDPSVTISSLL